MAPRKFDRYMVAISIGTHPKLGELSDGEFRAHVAGVLAVAAMAPVRGLLMVGALPARAVHVARAAGVSKTVAQSAIDKLVEVGILERDDEHQCLRVHDWEDYNPPPKTDASNAERQARYRSRNAPRNGVRNAPRNDDVTPPVTDTEVEVEVEGELPTFADAQVGSPRDKRAATRRKPIDQTKPPDDFPDELLPLLDDVRDILRDVWRLRGGLEPMPRGVGLAILRNRRADHRAVAQKLAHWLTAGTGQHATCRDIASRFGDWVASEGDAQKPVNVVTMRQQRPSAGDLIRKLREAEESRSA